MKGTIIRRGNESWRLKFDVGRDGSGKRQIRYITFRGKRKDAEAELAKLLTAHHEGTSVEPRKITVAEYLKGHLDRITVTPKTLERYRQLADQQIIPHLGAKLLQKLRPLHIQEWHSTLLKQGGLHGKPLAPRTVGHAHRVLHGALELACATEVVGRNVASAISPPKVEEEEVQIMTAPQIVETINKLRGTEWEAIAAVDLGTGVRRGELLALHWGDFDLDGASAKVLRSVEETRAGLRVKVTKTKYGRRTISLAPSTVEVLRAHLKRQRETRIALGMGRETAETLVFSTPDGQLLSPDNLSRDWIRLVKAKSLPNVTFHALRHTHASALIASGLDVVKISRRLGHSSPKVTLTIYAHLFEKGDHAAATAIEATLRFSEPNLVEAK
jgi:integrase